jgi:hypothetical protein
MESVQFNKSEKNCWFLCLACSMERMHFTNGTALSSIHPLPPSLPPPLRARTDQTALVGSLSSTFNTGETLSP